MFTLRDALPAYLKSAPDLVQRTVRKLGYLMTSWEKRTSNPSVSDIGPDVFNEFRRRCLKDKLSPHSIESSVTDVCTILKASHIAADVGRRLKRDEPDPQCPTLEQLGRAYLACEKATRPRLRYCPAPEYLRAFIVFGIWTGFRLDDLMRVKRDDVDEHAIRRRAAKTGKVHEIPNCTVVRRHLAALPHKIGPIFPAGAACPTRIREWLEDVCMMAGVPRFTPQQLRIAAVNSWSDADPQAGRIIHGEAISGRGAIRYYLRKTTPRKILDRAAPQYVWPTEMLLTEERDRRTSETASLIEVVNRLPATRLADLRRVAMASAE